jgi:plastocyanin
MKLNQYLILLLITGLAVAGCGKSDEDDLSAGGGSGSGSPAAGVMGTASVSGKVTLSGKAPKAAVISFDADPVCKAQHPGTTLDETVKVDAKGNLADVLVYVKEGASNYPAPSAGVTLLQKGCQYHPHVFGIQVNQAMEIVNGDNTLHNVHAMPVLNDAFNVGQPSQNMVTEKKFSKPEVPVKFKCDVHSWMHCVAGVFSHPFFGVSDTDGTFKISGLPAGSYTLAAYQEKYGESAPQKVDIKDGEAKSVTFTFTAQ